MELQEFSHTFDIDRTLNYSIIKNKHPKRNIGFGNALFDKQIIFAYLGDRKLEEPLINKFLTGNPSLYSRCVNYFFPLNMEEKAMQTLHYITDKINSFVGRNSEFGEYYLAIRKTSSGLWLCTLDSTKEAYFFGFIQKIFDEHFNFCMAHKNSQFSLEQPLIFFNCEMAAGEDFFSYFSRAQNPILEAMQKEGLFDEHCSFFQKN